MLASTRHLLRQHCAWRWKWRRMHVLNKPAGVCVDHVRRTVAIADTGNHRILLCSFDGHVMTTIGEGCAADARVCRAHLVLTAGLQRAGRTRRILGRRAIRRAPGASACASRAPRADACRARRAWRWTTVVTLYL